MKILNEFLKKRLIKKYIFELTPALRKGYGLQEQYTVPQIENAAKKCKLSMQYIPYAIALYRHEETYRTIKLYRINQSFLNILRKEISDWFFDGDQYRIRNVVNFSKSKTWKGGTCSAVRTG